MNSFKLEDVKELSFLPVVPNSQTQKVAPSDAQCPGCGQITTWNTVCGCCGTHTEFGFTSYGYGAIEYSDGTTVPIESIDAAESWAKRIEENPKLLVLKKIAVVSLFADHIQTIYENYENELSKYTYRSSLY